VFFKFAEVSSSEDVTKGAVSKSWDSPRKNDGRPVSRKSRPLVSASAAGKSGEDPFSSEAHRQTQHLNINLSTTTSFGGVGSVGNTTTTSAAVVGVKPAKSNHKKGLNRSSSGDILLSMDSSIESDGDYVLPGKEQPKKKITRRPSTGSNNNNHQRPASKERPMKSPRGSLLAPTVAATMRSLALAGNSNDAKIKQQSKAIHKTVIADEHKVNKKKKSTK